MVNRMNSIYEFQPEDAERFAREIGITARRQGDELKFKICPYCKSRKDKGTFAINLKTGAFNCKRASCGAKGNMLTLAKDFDFSLGRDVDAYLSGGKRFKNMKKYPRPKTKPKAVEYMEGRGISKEVTEAYALTTQRDHDNVLVFPFFDDDGNMQFAKYRNIEFVKGETKGSKEWCEANCKPILFGMDKCDPEVNDGTLVMTEGQIDSLSCAEAGIKNAVSVPTGAQGFTWVPYCWDFLSKFKTLIVFGDHENGHITLLAEMQTRFHGTVKHVREEDYLDCKDANEILRKHGKQAIIDAVARAVPVTDERFKKLSEVQRKDLTQVPMMSSGLSGLDAVIGGFYFGQLIILTGERGKGKSTLGSQFIAEAINQNHVSMCYSGEMPDWLFQDWFDRQCAGQSHINNRRRNDGYVSYVVDAESAVKIHAWYDAKCYLYDDTVLAGKEEQEALPDVVRKAIVQYGCKVILLDNLMTAMQDDMARDFYRQQSEFVRELATIARQYEVIIFLVAHPRKSNGYTFRNDDVSGSGNITNLAHMVLNYTDPLNDDDPGDQILQVTKNRLTGRTNMKGIPLWFQESSKRISEVENDFSWRFGWESAVDAMDGFTDTDGDGIPF